MGGEKMDRIIVWKYFAHITRYVRNRISTCLREYNLGSGQSDILRFLIHKGDGKSQDEISKELEIDNTTVTRTVQRLLKNGYIEKIKDEKDKRVNRIYLTEKAERVDSISRKIKEEALGVIIRGIKDDELEIFMKVLERMYKNMENDRGGIGFE